MSIANNSLLRRIVLEVRDGPAPLGLLPPQGSEADGKLLTLYRTLRVHRPPFATSLHFWAHALRALLEARCRPELFEALAANCLCEAIPAEQVRSRMERLIGRVSPADAGLSSAPFVAAYRMIDQPVLVSWVAEHDDEFVALFRASPDWLQTAKPLRLD